MLFEEETTGGVESPLVTRTTTQPISESDRTYDQQSNPKHRHPQRSEYISLMAFLRTGRPTQNWSD